MNSTRGRADSVSGEPGPIVIGAGVSGLVRALALSDRGEFPTIVDPNPPGGSIRSVTEAGSTLECGATTLVETPEAKDLLRRLGLEKRMLSPVFPKYRQYLWYRGAAHAVPRGPLQLLGSKLLPGVEKFFAIRGVFRTGVAARLGAGCSVHSLFSEIFSPHVAANLIAPVLRGIFGGNTNSLIASAVFPKLWDHFAGGGSIAGYVRKRSALGKRAVFRLDGGNATLITALVEALRGKAHFVSAAATNLTFDGRFNLFLSNGERLTGSSVSIATSGAATGAYIGEISPDLAALENALRYAPLAVIHIQIDRAAPLPEKGFGILFPENQAGLLGILFNTQLFPSTSPPGKSVLTVCMGGVGRMDLVSEPVDRLAALARTAVKDHLGVSDSEFLRCTCWERGIPQYEAGVLELHRVMREVERKYPALSFIGADRGGIGVPARIECALAFNRE